MHYFHYSIDFKGPILINKKKQNYKKWEKDINMPFPENKSYIGNKHVKTTRYWNNANQDGNIFHVLSQQTIS